MNWISDFIYFAREGWINFHRSRLLSVFSILIISVSIAILTVFSTVFFNVDHYLTRLEQQPVYSIFMTDDATEKETNDMAAWLKGLDGVSELHIMTPEEGMQRLAKRFPLAGQIETSLDSNPIPYSIRLRIDVSALSEVRKALNESSIVAGFYSPNFFLEQLKSITAAVTFFIMLIAAILVLASVFTIYNVIRITILARKVDIEIMQLVGADMKYIRVPFAVEGMLQGFCGGVIGMLLGEITVILIRSQYLSRFSYLPFLSRLDGMPAENLIAMVLLSVIFGLAGSILAALRIDYV